MSRGQASPRRTQPEDVGTDLLPLTTAMPRPPGLPGGHTLATSDLSNISNSSNADTNSSDSYNTTDPAGTSYLDQYLAVDLTTAAKPTEDYSRLKEQFYQSYNPQVGVHTAAVLGGILGWLIVYLVYKTKVKKWVVNLAKKKYNKRQQRQKEKEICDVFAEFEDHDLNPDAYLFHCPHANDLHIPQVLQQRLWQTDQALLPADCPPRLQEYCRPVLERRLGDLTFPFKQCHVCGVLHEDLPGKPSCLMPSIVVDSYPPTLPGDPAGSPPAQDISEQDCGGSGSKKSRKKVGYPEKEKKKKYRRKRNRSRSRQLPGVTVVGVEETDTKCLLPPPCTQSDSARATARWVQNMPLLMRSQQDVNGLILKVQPDMLGTQKQSSCPLISSALHYAALPLLGLPTTGWNNSMPALADNTFGSLKSSGEELFPSDKRTAGPDDEDLQLLQPVPCCAARPMSSSSQPGRSQLRHPVPPLSPFLSLSSPSPRLTGFLLPKQSQVSSSAANLAVPGSGILVTSSYSAPASPVPIPVTPTVTILHKASSRGSRGLPPSLHRPDSEISVSSSLSSFDPLVPLQPDCHCVHKQLPQPPRQPEADAPGAKASSRASWTVFDDGDDKEDSCSGVSGSCGGKEGGCSRQNSCRSNLSSPSVRRPGSTTRSGPHDTVWSLETKL